LVGPELIKFFIFELYWNFAQIIFSAGFTGQGVSLNKDDAVVNLGPRNVSLTDNEPFFIGTAHAYKNVSARLVFREFFSAKTKKK
jgi:hypothetical protein